MKKTKLKNHAAALQYISNIKEERHIKKNNSDNNSNNNNKKINKLKKKNYKK